MTEKPILLIATKATKEQIKTVESIVNEWNVKTVDNMTETDYSKVEIIYSWNSEVFNHPKIYEKMDSLRWIQLLSAGADRVPTNIMNRDDVTVTNVSGIHKETITEMVFAYILGFNHQFFESLQHQEKKEWRKPEGKQLHILKGQSLLVFGAGNIGQEIGRIGQAFGMHTIGVNTSGEDRDFFDHMIKLEDWQTVIKDVDGVVNALPATDQTMDLFDVPFFQAMQASAIFINIGRGSAVVEEALIMALENQWIAGAYLDVFREEPLPDKSPLWETPNLIITPHYSGSFDNYDQRAFEIFEENLKNYVEEGKPKKNIISKENGY